jgi:hypothetical protein
MKKVSISFLSRGSQGGQFVLDCTLNDFMFLFNEGDDVRQIADRLRAQFREDACGLRTVQFWIT